MALFKKKSEIKREKKSVLEVILASILEIGDESDYEYLLKISAKNFYEELKLKEIIENSGDNLDFVFRVLNLIFRGYGLGEFSAEIDEDEKVITLTHINSPFPNRDYFFEELYKLFFSDLLDTEVKIKLRAEDEKNIFIITV